MRLHESPRARFGSFLNSASTKEVATNRPDYSKLITVRLNAKGVVGASERLRDEGATVYYQRKAGQLIYGKQNLHKGAVGLVPTNLDGYFSTKDLPAFDINLCVVDPSYLSCYLLRETYYRSLERFSTGTGSKRIGEEAFLGLDIPLPPLPEQRKIAEFFSLLDERIGKQEVKVALLQEQKRGYMQRIFSQELRFKKEDGSEYPEWQTISFHDVLNIHYGKDFKTLASLEGLYPVLGSGGELGKTNSPLHEGPSVLIGRKGTIDKPRFMAEPFATVDTMFYTTIHKDFDPKFVYFLFQNIDWRSKSEATGVPSLNTKIILGQRASIPVLSEQQKMAAFLSALEDEILLEERKHSLLQRHKKAYLQLIFAD